MANPSQYPDDLDTFPTAHQDNVDEKILALTVNSLADATNKIEAALGLAPRGSHADVAARLDVLEFWSSRIISADDVVQLTDSRGVIESDATTAVVVRIPLDADLPAVVGFTVDVFQFGAGQVTVGGASGVTVHSLNGFLALSGPYAVARLRKRGANDWVATGDLVDGGVVTPPPLLPTSDFLPLLVGGHLPP